MDLNHLKELQGREKKQLVIAFPNPTNKIDARYLTRRVGDKRDNLEFVRRGGRGGVLPKVDSELREV